VSLEPVRRIPLTKRSEAPSGPPEACVQCQVLVEPADATSDVIFIHGLHGSLRNTWRQGDWGMRGRRRTESPVRRWLREGSCSLPQKSPDCVEHEPYANCWPKDWLPLDCPGARVIALNYSTDPYLWRPHWMRQVNRSVSADFIFIFPFTVIFSLAKV
jgi:protein SERAC1